MSTITLNSFSVNCKINIIALEIFCRIKGNFCVNLLNCDLDNSTCYPKDKQFLINSRLLDHIKLSILFFFNPLKKTSLCMFVYTSQVVIPSSSIEYSNIRVLDSRNQVFLYDQFHCKISMGKLEISV